MADDDQKDQAVEEAAEETPSEAPVEEAAPEPEPAVEAAPAPEEPATEKISAPLSNSLKGIVEQIEKLSVLELADLVHALEDRFGVSAQAAIVAGPAAASSSTGEPQEEKTTFNVVLSAAGANKIAVIKAVRELVPTLGLKEAKDLVEAAPKPVLESVNKDTANEAKTKLEAAGGTVELQ